MERSAQTQELAVEQAAGAEEQTGRYVYCLAWAGEVVSLGAIGIEDRQVYTVAHHDLCAVVHTCPAQPYQSGDSAVVAAWVLAHSRVVEAAWKRWGTTLPITFNTIIKGEEGTSADENLKAWLRTEYDSLRAKLEALQGKAEYGVQVFWDPVLIGRQVAESSPEIRRLEEEIRSKPRGIAYMYRQRLETTLKKEIETRAEAACRELYARLRRCVDQLRVEKTKKAQEGRQMLVNFSCLVSEAKYPDLEAELEKVSSMDGFSVRLAGPLAPYSFC